MATTAKNGYSRPSHGSRPSGPGWHTWLPLRFLASKESAKSQFPQLDSITSRWFGGRIGNSCCCFCRVSSLEVPAPTHSAAWQLLTAKQPNPRALLLCRQRAGEASSFSSSSAWWHWKSRGWCTPCSWEVIQLLMKSNQNQIAGNAGASKNCLSA